MTTTDDTVLDDELMGSSESDEESTEESTEETESGEPEKASRDRDFTKVRELHKELAEYINANSGLEALTPNQVKAVLYLRTDFNNTPEQVAKRDERKARKAAEEQRYAGLNDEQKKARKAAERANEQAAKMAERARKAQEDADRLLADANAGEDIASQVEAAQESVPDPLTTTPEVPDDTAEDRPRRGIGRRNR